MKCGYTSRCWIKFTPQGDASDSYDHHLGYRASVLRLHAKQPEKLGELLDAL